MTYLIGIDVSSNNSSNWEDDAWDYCWVKATEGKSYKNPDYSHQIGVVRNRGKQLGHYHWLNDGDVTAQVHWFTDNSDVRDGDMIAVDWEDPSDPTTAQKDEAIRQLQGLFPGSKVGLYCNKDWWINHDTSSFFGDYLWIANYTSADNPGIQADWTFWQYTYEPYDKNRGKFADLTELKAWAGSGESPPEPPDPAPAGVWFSTDYLYPQVKPNPTNPNVVKKGDTVQVTASGGLTARTLPGGPPSVDDSGETIVRDKGYQFKVSGDLVDGWVTGGTNWYSSDYLMVAAPTPPPSKPAWSAQPTIILPMSQVPGSVSYLQDLTRVAAITASDGTQHSVTWILAQDYENEGNTRFLAFGPSGGYLNTMTVKNGGHGQTFHAYRSAAGNLYVWTLIGDYAYRIKWQPGKTITTSSSGVEKMAYGDARPVGTYESFIGFRDATDTEETFTIHDRFGFTDPDNNSADPIKKVKVAKRTNYTQQSWAVSYDRIYRLMGATNDDPPHGSKLHILDVFDWNGKLLLDRFDVTAMGIETSSDEPEGLTFSGTPGSLLASKREGSSDKTKRSVPVWTLTGLP